MTISLDTSPAAVWSILASWPQGYFTTRYAGRRYGVTNTAHANGQSFKLYAEELGGNDRISLNVYRPPSRAEPALKPCEMPVGKVTAFVAGAVVEPAAWRDRTENPGALGLGRALEPEKSATAAA